MYFEGFYSYFCKESRLPGLQGPYHVFSQHNVMCGFFNNNPWNMLQSLFYKTIILHISVINAFL